MRVFTLYTFVLILSGSEMVMMCVGVYAPQG